MSDTPRNARAATGSTFRPPLVLLFLLGMCGVAAAQPAPLIDSALVLRQANGGRDFRSPLGIALDTLHREVVVANTGLSRIEFFDFRTFPLGAFAHRVPGADGDLTDGAPGWLAVDGRGRILVSDLMAPYVDALDPRGRSLARLTLPAPDDSLGGGQGPGALAVASDGRLLVASRGRKGRVHVFGADDTLLGSWGVPGRARGELSGITGLAWTADGRIVVCCALTDLAVQLFDARGAFVAGWGVHDIGPGNFSYPSGVAVTDDGRIWVSDAIRQNIQVFDPAGTFLGAVGGAGSGPGEFTYPSALAGDGRGLMALVEPPANRFQLMWVR